MQSARKSVGVQGELLARSFLADQGYAITQVNWHCAVGEIDIVAQKQDVIHFVEVRTRRAEQTNSAMESIGPHKQARMISAAHTYLEANNLIDVIWQIDVIAVALRRTGDPIIDWVENAIGW